MELLFEAIYTTKILAPILCRIYQLLSHKDNMDLEATFHYNKVQLTKIKQEEIIETNFFTLKAKNNRVSVHFNDTKCTSEQNPLFSKILQQRAFICSATKPN